MMPKLTEAKTHDFREITSFIITVYGEQKPGDCEDAYVYSLNIDGALIGAYDGSGGSGAKKYTKLQGKTGAYIGSRIACGSVRDWFSKGKNRNEKESAQAVKAEILQNLQTCYEVGKEETRIKNSMAKIFPTTAAFAVCAEYEDNICVDCYWAGDSRVYLLNEDGLAQLSEDDLGVKDAMENLYMDGIMSNVISLKTDFTVHRKRVWLDKPGIVFAATDGCFGYLKTPMDFEYLLIRALLKSNSAREWEDHLKAEIGNAAGDDYTFTGIALNYAGFEPMRSSFSERNSLLYRDYISFLEGAGIQEITHLWNLYKENYYRYS